MQEIRMTIHMVPVAKGRARSRVVGKFAMHYTPKETRVAENNILAQAIPYKPASPFQKQVYVSLKFYMPIPKSMSKKEQALAQAELVVHTKKPDLDNLEKAVLDALNEVFWRDDSIIYSVSKEKKYSINPRIDIFIQGE